jgi:KRAB domain-containing zinc finger protein
METAASKFREICLCCLTEEGQFKNMLEEAFPAINYLAGYTTCSGISPDIESTKNICSTCEDKLRLSYEFRELCRTSYKTFLEKNPVDSSENVKDEILDFVVGDPGASDHQSSDTIYIKDEEISVTPIVDEGGTRKSRRKRHRNDEECEIRPPQKKRLKKHAKPTHQYPHPPSDVEASDLDADFFCLHCDIYLPNHREYKLHYDQHRTGAGYKRIARVCPVCQVETHSFVSHMLENHKDYKPFRCKYCPKQCNTSGNLRSHLEAHAAKVVVACQACQEKFDRLPYLRAHIHSHENGKNEFFCPICGLPSKLFKPLFEHIESVHRKTTLFPCSGCKKIFMVGKNFTNHACSGEKVESEATDFKCTRCNASFRSEDDLFCHEMAVCNTPDYFHCEDCEKSFASKIKLQSHVRMIHRGTINRICQICGHGSKTNRAYEMHMLSHNERSLKCPEPGCESAFRHQYHLNQHILGQHGANANEPRQKPYICDFCKKKFSSLYAIKRHMSVHSDSPLLKPFLCTICGKRLQAQISLDKHLLAHSGVKSVKCSVCPQLFITQQSANQHYEMTHVNVCYRCKVCEYSAKTRTAFYEHLFHHRGFSPYNCPNCPSKYVNAFL